MALASIWVVSRRLLRTSFWKTSFHLRRGLRMFSPARLTTASQVGSPDVASSSHVIRPGPGFRETNVTSWPLAFSSWLRAVPMNPVPPPDRKTQVIYPLGGCPVCGPSSDAIPSDTILLSSSASPPRNAEVTKVTGIWEIRFRDRRPSPGCPCTRECPPLEAASHLSMAKSSFY